MSATEVHGTYHMFVGIGEPLTPDSVTAQRNIMGLSTRFSSIRFISLKGTVPSASVTGSFSLSEGVWIDDGSYTSNANSRGKWVEDDTALYLELPLTLIQISSVEVDMVNNALVVHTIEPHQLDLLKSWSADYPLSLVGTSLVDAASSWEVVDDRTIQFVVGDVEVTTLESQLGTVNSDVYDEDNAHLHLFVAPMLPNILASFVSHAMTIVSRETGKGWRYGLNISPVPALSVSRERGGNPSSTILMRNEDEVSNEISLWDVFGFPLGAPLPVQGNPGRLTASVSLAGRRSALPGRIDAAMHPPTLTGTVSATLTRTGHANRTITLEAIDYTPETLCLAWNRQAGAWSTLRLSSNAWSLQLSRGTSLTFMAGRATFAALLAFEEVVLVGLESASTTAQGASSITPVSYLLADDALPSRRYSMNEDGDVITIPNAEDEAMAALVDSSGSETVERLHGMPSAVTPYTVLSFAGGHRLQQGGLVFVEDNGFFLVERIESETTVRVRGIINQTLDGDDDPVPMAVNQWVPSRIAVQATKGMPFESTEWILSDTDASSLEAPGPAAGIPVEQEITYVIMSSTIPFVGGALMNVTPQQVSQTRIQRVILPCAAAFRADDDPLIHTCISANAVTTFLSSGPNSDGTDVQVSFSLCDQDGNAIANEDCAGVTVELLLDAKHRLSAPVGVSSGLR